MLTSFITVAVHETVPQAPDTGANGGQEAADEILPAPFQGKAATSGVKQCKHS